MDKPKPGVVLRRRASRVTLAAAVASALAVAVPAASGAATQKAYTAASPLKVAFLYENSTNDLGWDTAMYQGEQGVKAKYGSKIQVTDKVVPDTKATDTAAVSQLVSQGYKLIFLTAFNQQLYVDPTQYPDVHFVQAE